MGLMDQAVNAYESPGKQTDGVAQGLLDEVKKLVVTAFSGAFGVPEDQIVCRPITPVRASITVDDMEFIADAMNVRVGVEGATVTFKLKIRCPQCQTVIRTVKVRTLSEIGAAVAKKCGRHTCSVGKAAAPVPVVPPVEETVETKLPGGKGAKTGK